LKNVAEVLSGAVTREDDFVARYGGEEFVDLQDAKLLGDKREVTLSLGVASFPAHASTRKTLVEKADKALYIAKKAGRNRYMVWDESFGEEAVSKDIVREVITGDAVKDAGRMMVLFDILDIAGESLPFDLKMEKALEVVLSETGTENITLLLYDDGRCTDSFSASRKGIKPVYNNEIIDNVIKTQSPVFMVDWDNEVQDESGMVDWKSLAVVPVIKNGVFKGILYLSASVKDGEFSDDAAGFICNAATLLGTLLQGRCLVGAY
jgi:hypothetical protein